jgi:ubiquitin carboxyl-terminal hydrolase 6/32
LCAWYQCCIGCAIPDDDYPTIVTCGDSISIDWHFAVDVATNGFGTRLNQLEQTMSQSPFRAKVPATIVITNHPSSNDDARKKGLYGGTVTLEDCLDAFAKEEKIPEAYCSRCKDFRVQTKRMSLWRLPPVVIIQLKRFQFTQHTRRKLRDLVVFPLEGLDLSRILAPDLSKPSEVKTDVPPEAPVAKTQPEVISHEYFDPLDPLYSNSSYIDEQSFHQDSILPTPERDDDPMSKSSYRGRSDGAMLYDLYAVIHHQGALSGGHYVASLKSEIDGQWRLFNDAQIFDIHSREVVDSSAYILFYIRRDVKDASLEDFWDIRARSGQGMTEEEVESIMNGRSERCTIS